METIKCKNCNKDIEKNSKYCTHCGNIVKHCTRLILTILLLTFFTIFIFFKLFMNNVSKAPANIYGNETFNLTAYADNFIKYGDWLIFSNGVSTVLNSTVSNIEEGIYKYNFKTGQVIELDAYDGNCFNLVGDTLYYISKFNEIKYINLNTLDFEYISWINGDDYKATDLLICDNYLYYRDKNGQNIFKTDLQGKEKQLIAEYAENKYQVYNNFIYYIDVNSSNLYKKDITNNDSPVKAIDEKVSQFYYKNDNILYITENNLKLLNTIDNTTVILKQGISSNFTMNNNLIYMYLSDSKSIIEYNIDNKSEKIILENIENDINRLQFFDNTLYYSYRKANGLFSNNVTTNLYSINISGKKVEKLSFRTSN